MTVKTVSNNVIGAFSAEKEITVRKERFSRVKNEANITLTKRHFFTNRRYKQLNICCSGKNFHYGSDDPIFNRHFDKQLKTIFD